MSFQARSWLRHDFLSCWKIFPNADSHRLDRVGHAETADGINEFGQLIASSCSINQQVFLPVGTSIWHCQTRTIAPSAARSKTKSVGLVTTE